jgi:carboxyl-terminal processing protease
MSNAPSRRTVAVALVALLMVVCFLTGYLVAAPTRNLSGLKSTVNHWVMAMRGDGGAGVSVDLSPEETFQSALDELTNRYVEPIKDADKLTYGALRGMLASLGDPYTEFMDPEEYQAFRQENKGQFEGIGAALGATEVETPAGEQLPPIRCPHCGLFITDYHTYRIVVRSVFPEGPAHTAGLQAGDIIIRVDDTVVDGMSVSEVATLIRGPAGSKVTLIVTREGEKEPIKVTITRARVDLPTVESKMLADHVGYIRLAVFNDNAERDVEKALRELKGEGMRALILDLRDNPGGSLDACTRTAGFFLGGDRVAVYTKDRDQDERPYYAGNTDFQSTVPLAVLVNKGSASASEILAGAIRDWRAGTLFGTTTFGKGSVQTIVGLADGSALRITTSKWLLPKHEAIDHKGIKPDHVVELPDKKEFAERLSADDTQAQAAVDWLKTKVAEAAK